MSKAADAVKKKAFEGRDKYDVEANSGRTLTRRWSPASRCCRLLEKASGGVLIPDRKLAGSAQLVFLPNRGDFYQTKADKADALALTAYATALRDGFTLPASSDAAKQEWRLEADQVAQFVDDVCTRDAEARSKAADVFSAYQDWALDNGIKQTMSQKGLRDRLTRLGFGYHKDSTARYVTGLRVPHWL